MRALDVSQYQLALNPSRKTAVRVLVAGPKDPFGLDMVTYPLFDLTDLCDLDWIKSWEVSEDVSNQVATATVTIFRSSFGISLSPFVPDSPAQQLAALQLRPSTRPARIAFAEEALVWVGRRIQIQTQLCPDLAEVDPDGAWDTIFDGFIDRPDFGQPSNCITLGCRDLGLWLQDYYITQQQPLVSPATDYTDDAQNPWYANIDWSNYHIDHFFTDILTHTIIKDYIAAGAGDLTDALKINVQDDPGWAIYEPPNTSDQQPFVKKEALAQMFQDLIAQIGFDCRFWWREATRKHQLTIRHQNRYFAGVSSAPILNAGGVNETWLLDTAWSQRHPTAPSTGPTAPSAQPAPSARASHAMAFDPSRGRTVLFGGSQGHGFPLGDTWEWSGREWLNVTPAGASPIPRYDHAMVYDSARNVTLLFGGNNGSGGVLNDTWSWDGANWTELLPVHSPPARCGFAMSFNSALNLAEVFGGTTVSGYYANDLWEWDGTDWTPHGVTGTIPTARTGCRMVYDSARDVTVLFGGFGPYGSLGRALNELWEFDGSYWTQIFSYGPANRFDFAMAYDSDRHVAVLSGGFDDFGQVPDTWSWNGTAWVDMASISGVNPTPRFGAAMAYDSANHVCVLSEGLYRGSPPDVPFILTPDLYRLTAAPVDLATVRNKVRAPWANAAAGDNSSVSFCAFQEDADSEQRYGVRAMEMTSDATGNIQEMQQAENVAKQVLNDLSRPWFTPQLDAIFLPFAQLNDCLMLTPYSNADGDDLWTDPIWVSIQSLHHSGDEKGNVRTQLTTAQVYVHT